ncbi:ketopantoate hydroxymethyltransferase [Bacillus horti]|uniref:Ketopantoate hydroxymethyltransferase n=1 Tax=Caldalkalibacillus horti TaxID=77523 RepID=A0ABT9W0A0_9BACI|nr:ketopantoate hydroxymethyltransferase [Bacillus horti]MDQ0166646.1 hypothetical protein [Bacillus horti]
MITVEFLQEVAAFVDRKIDRVVLNGTYEIDEFEIKNLTNETVVMQYMIPNGSVSTISLIELRDEDGGIISSNSVNIPVTADTLMLQSIEIGEG